MQIPFFSKSKIEQRNILSEINPTEEGIFSGYITVWDQIDDYNSKFRKGSFERTIKEDLPKVKVFYNHSDLIGKAIEVIEDNKGVLASGKINLETRAGKDTWEFLKDGTINGLSFRFRTTKPDKFEKGIRVIQEIELMEFGPVVFPSGKQSLITDIRATFGEYYGSSMLYAERETCIMALVNRLEELYSLMPTDVTKQSNDAINEFQSYYMDWLGRYKELLGGLSNTRETNELDWVLDTLKQIQKQVKEVI